MAFVFGDADHAFMKFGPQPTLVILGVTINTWDRYVALQIFIMIFQVTDTIVNEFASPILGFYVYNPDKLCITEFTKLQLQCYCQSMWFVNNMKDALMLLVSVSQIDVAFSKVLYADIATCFTIRTLINKKQFIQQADLTEVLVQNEDSQAT